MERTRPQTQKPGSYIIAK